MSNKTMIDLRNVNGITNQIVGVLDNLFRVGAAFLMAITLSVTSYAIYPDPVDDYVNDFAEVINASDKAYLRDKLKDLESDTGIEMVVVTINSMSDYDKNAETDIKLFSRVLFNNWGVGQLPDNDGVMLLVAVEDRKTRIQMGRGYENRYDTRMQSVINETMLPQFRQQQYSQGVVQGSDAVINELTSTISWFEFYKWQILFGVLAIIAFFAGISLIKSGKKGWGYAVLTLGVGLLVAVIMGILSSDRHEDGFGGGDSGDGGADGEW